MPKVVSSLAGVRLTQCTFAELIVLNGRGLISLPIAKCGPMDRCMSSTYVLWPIFKLSTKAPVAASGMVS